MNNMRPPILSHQNSSPPNYFLSPPSNLFPQYPTPPTSSLSTISLLSSWSDNQEQLPESWSQLLLGGLVGEEDKSDFSQIQAKKLEIWEEQILHQTHESSPKYVYDQGHVDNKASKRNNWPHMLPCSSPKSCVTSLSSNLLGFSSNKAEGRHPPQDRSSECYSTATCGVLKKSRVQPSSTQSTVKVRKEKLGDRITALHQLVSPFGKTDTASVLLEAFGYIRFLQSQIEALSIPYLGSGSGNIMQQQSVQGKKNCLFPEDPGQLLNDNFIKRKGASDQDSHEELKDLRSRGLCLVPLSCTNQVGSENGADYWASALNCSFQE